MTSAAKQTQFCSLEEIIKSSVLQNPASPDSAARHALALLAENKPIYNQVHDALIEKAVLASVVSEIQNQRSTLMRNPDGAGRGFAKVQGRRAPGFESMVASLNAEKRTLMDYPLVSVGKTIAECTLDDIAHASRFHKALAKGNLKKAEWLDGIHHAAERKGGKVIGEVLNLTDLKGLAMKAGLPVVSDWIDE